MGEPSSSCVKESPASQHHITSVRFVLNKISFGRREPVKAIGNFVQRALICRDGFNLEGQGRNALDELRGRRRDGGRGRTAEVRRELFCFARGPAQQEPAPIGLGKWSGRL